MTGTMLGHKTNLKVGDEVWAGIKGGLTLWGDIVGFTPRAIVVRHKDPLYSAMDDGITYWPYSACMLKEPVV